jgi:hypothetical protein
MQQEPHKLETEEDRSRLIAFFGQIRDRLILLLCDKHERLVPDIMEWQLTEADINKDIKVSDLFHFSAIVTIITAAMTTNLKVKKLPRLTNYFLKEKSHLK